MSSRLPSVGSKFKVRLEYMKNPVFKKKRKRPGDMDQAVECLAKKCESLSLSLPTTHRKRNMTGKHNKIKMKGSLKTKCMAKDKLYIYVVRLSM